MSLKKIAGLGVEDRFMLKGEVYTVMGVTEELPLVERWDQYPQAVLCVRKSDLKYFHFSLNIFKIHLDSGTMSILERGVITTHSVHGAIGDCKVNTL